MKLVFFVLYDENYLLSDDTLNLLTNIIAFLGEIDGRKKLQGNIFEDLVNSPLRHIVKYIFTERHNRNFTEQQLKDIQSELKQANEKDGIDSMQHLIKKTGPFTNQDQEKFDDLVKQFEQSHNLPGLGITENERTAIVSALNMTKGHPYVITECSGANQVSQCPDCGEHIGGQNHRLLATNRHFG